MNSRTIRIHDNGKYYCPFTECDYSELKKNFNRLATHGRNRHNCELVTYEKMKNNWQKQVQIDEQNFKMSTLNQIGVVLLKKFISKRDTDLLNAVVTMAETICENQNSFLKKVTISGGMQMIDIPSDFFICPAHPKFYYAANLFKKLNERIGRLIGKDYKISGNLSVIQTPYGSTNQFIHADNMLKNRYNGLIVLSKEAKPTEFLPKPKVEIAIFNQPELDEKSGKITDPVLRNQFKKKFQCFWDPIEELEERILPISNEPLTAGDMIFFEADMIHRGVACDGNKTLLFFHAQPSCLNLKDIEDIGVQFHVGLVGGLFYGNNPKNKNDMDEYFSLIKMHDDSISGSHVSLFDLLHEVPKNSYLKWYKTKFSNKKLKI
jgi:hypothetical protein